MISETPLKIGYIVKMYPRLSETFILNEILQHEKSGAEITIFSIKKPNEGKFHSQVSQLKARVYYLEDLDPRKWSSWLSKVWNEIDIYQDTILRLLGESLSRQDSERIELLMASAWVASHVRKLGISHLHAHFASLPSTIAYLTHQITGVPFSFTAHAKDIFVYDMEEHLLREKLHKAKFVATVTSFNCRYLLEKAPEIEPEKIKVFYNGVDLDRFQPNDEIPRNKEFILSVGRLVPKKGLGYLIDACAILKQRDISFKCVIVGEGPDYDMLQAKRVEYGLEESVEFAGALRQDEVLGLMQSASVLCLPCTVAEDGNQDALPTVLLEALATGLPVVSTAISGIPEIIDSEDDGILVEPEDAESLANALERLLLSDTLRAQFACRGLIKASERFDLRKNAGRLLEQFRAGRTTTKTDTLSQRIA
jgi:glycosyltransferase involved in cell wall biosynthesis